MESHAWTEPSESGRPPVSPSAATPIRRNVAALASGQLVTWTMTLAWTLVVPRLLGPAAIGLVVSAISVTSLFAVALGAGTKVYLVRAIVADPDELSPLLATGTAMRLLLSPLFLLIIFVYAHFAHYGYEGTVVLYLAAVVTILSLIAEPMEAVFQATERMQYLAYSEVINKSLLAVGGIVLALVGFGAVGFASCWLVASGVVLAADVLWLRRYVQLGFRTDARRLIQMAKQSMAYWGLGMFLLIYFWIDTAMLSLMTNSTVVGWYGVTTRLLQTSMVVPVLLSTVWLPRLVSVFERTPRALQQEARTPTELVLLLGIPIAGGIAAAAGPMIRLVYGPAYSHAIPVMVILGLCVPPTYLNIMVSQVLIAAKRQIVWTWVMGGATVLNLALNAVLIPVTQHRFGNGAIGAAVSLVATEVIICTAGIAIAGRGVIGRGPLRRIGLVTTASAAMWCVSFVLRGLGAAPSLAAGCLTFVLLVVAFRLLTPIEIDFIRGGLARASRGLPTPLRRCVAGLVPTARAGKRQ